MTEVSELELCTEGLVDLTSNTSRALGLLGETVAYHRKKLPH